MRKKRIKFAFVIYWLVLAYTVSAIIWWFIELNINNTKTTDFRLKELDKTSITYNKDYNEIVAKKKANTAQFLGEGVVFLFVIITGAIFVFRAIVKELKNTKEHGNFLMAITHELKTPIAVSKLNLETIQKHKLSAEQQDKLLANTLSETNRLAALCSNLLISYQMEGSAYKTTKEELNLSELLLDITNSFQTRFQSRKIISHITPNLYSVGDTFLLEIAINNLLENAVKYSPKEKPITISLDTLNNISYIKIIDEGQGIADVEKRLVFNKFYRIGNEATKSAKGTGLGLYLASKISKTHDGKITVENNPAGGSVFTFALNSIN